MLTEDQVSSFRQKGFLLLDDIYTREEIDECSREYDELFRRKGHQNLEATWQGDWKTNNEKTSVFSIHNLQNHSATFTRMLLNGNLLNAVSKILGTDDILLHHTKAHLKPPGNGSPFPMHQDYHYFPHKEDSLLAVFIHLDDTDSTNGGLAIYPGSHLLGPQEDKSTKPGWHYVDQEKFPVDEAEPVIAKRGQVAIFSYLLVHGSYPNSSERPRRMLLFQLMSAHDKPLRAVHRSPGQGVVLRGRNPFCDADISRRHENN